LDQRIARLEERLAALQAIPDSEKGQDYLGWKEEFLIDHIADLKRTRGPR